MWEGHPHRARERARAGRGEFRASGAHLSFYQTFFVCLSYHPAISVLPSHKFYLAKSYLALGLSSFQIVSDHFS